MALKYLSDIQSARDPQQPTDVANKRYVDAAVAAGGGLDQTTADSRYVNITGDTLTGKLTSAAASTGGAGINIPHGTSPTTPTDGDIWTTTSGIYTRINGETLGPLGLTGPPGLSTNYTLESEWDYSTTTAAPPASGGIRFNSTDWTAVTTAWIHEVDRNGTDRSTEMALSVPGNMIAIRDTVGNIATFTTVSQTDNGTYRTIGLTYVSHTLVTANMRTRVWVTVFSPIKTSAESDAAYVNVSGDTMTGDLTLDRAGLNIVQYDNGARLSYDTDGGFHISVTGASNTTIGLDSEMGVIDVNGARIVNAADPTDLQEVATKTYVDSVAGGLQTRTTATITTASLAADATESGTVTLANGYRLLRITTSRAARVRLYTTTAKRDADLGRVVGTDPIGDHGLILDYVTTASVLSADLSPVVDGWDGKPTPDGVVSYNITNLGGAGTVIVNLTWIRSE